MSPKHGRYSFINVPEGTYQMTVRQSGMKPRAEQVQVSAANPVVSEIKLASGDKVNKAGTEIIALGGGATLRGKISDEQHRGITGAKIIVSQSTSSVSVSATTGGSYELKQLKPGLYRVLVSKFGYDDAAQPISLREGE